MNDSRRDQGLAEQSQMIVNHAQQGTMERPTCLRCDEMRAGRLQTGLGQTDRGDGEELAGSDFRLQDTRPQTSDGRRGNGSCLLLSKSTHQCKQKAVSPRNKRWSRPPLLQPMTALP